MIKAGHEVRVVLTKGAEKFVRHELFNYLGAQNVYASGDDFRFPHELHQKGESTVLHIDLANWAERMIIAPLSANTLSDMAHGKANDLLTSVFLAFPQEKFISVFPAMNTKMLHHPFVQENLNNLKKLRTLSNIYVDETSSGELACGELGKGRLAEVEKIALIGTTAHKVSKKEKVLITTGGTIAPLDPVRYLANPSTGKMGFEIAKSAIQKGYEVTIIKGHNSIKDIDDLNSLSSVKVIEAKTTSQMHEAVHNEITNHQVFISSAAVADIEFSESTEKIKKQVLNEGALPFTPAKDILKSVLDLECSNLKTIGFAAETNLSEQMLQDKWDRKPTDLLIGNSVHNGVSGSEQKGFGANTVSYLIKDNQEFISLETSKTEMADWILNKVETWKF
jgi:phosphopantothenoylcysteine decarboxylase/phosphopantothenate--cysteine ligase